MANHAPVGRAVIDEHLRRRPRAGARAAAVVCWLLSAACAAPVGDPVAVKTGVGDALVRQQRYEQAIAAYEAARNADRSAWTPSVKLAALYGTLNRHRDARTELERALRTLEDQPDPNGTLRAERAEVNYQMGQVLERLGSALDAIPPYERAVALSPDNPTYRLGLSLANLRTGRLDVAHRQIVEQPAFVGPLLLLGLASLLQGDYPAAATQFETLTRQLPTSTTLAALAALSALGPAGGRGVASPPKPPVPTMSRDDLLSAFWHARVLETEAVDPTAIPPAYEAAAQAPLTVDARLTELVSASVLGGDINRFLEDVGAQLRRQADEVVQRVAQATDREPPTVTIDLEAITVTTSHAFLAVTGVARDDTLVSSITANGQPARLDRSLLRTVQPRRGDEVEFVARVPLELGDNLVRVEARDPAGNRAFEEVRVFRSARSPGVDMQRRWALFVSVSRHRDPRIPSRPGSVGDTARLAERLGYGVPNKEALVDEAATRERVLGALSDLVAAQPGDEILVVFDLWGRRLSLRDGEPPRLFLVPYDARPEDLAATAIDPTRIAEMLAASRAARIVVVIDAAYAPGVLGERGSFGEGRTLLWAAQQDSRAQADASGRSVFVAALIDAFDTVTLEKPAPSLGDVVGRAMERVSFVTRGLQQPVLVGDDRVIRGFALPRTDTGEKTLADVLSLALSGQLNRRALLRAARVIVHGSREADDQAVATALSEFTARRLAIPKLVERLIPSASK